MNRCVGNGLYELWRDGMVVKRKANVGRLKEYRKRLLDDNEDDSKEICFPPMKMMKVCVRRSLKHKFMTFNILENTVQCMVINYFKPQTVLQQINILELYICCMLSVVSCISLIIHVLYSST